MCKSSHLNVSSTDDLDPDSEGCEYIVYFSHGLCVLMVAVSASVSLGHLLKAAFTLVLLGAHALIVLVFVDDFYDYYNTRVYSG